ncbi:MAG TPA: hypothetical protein ENI77_07175 [Nitrospirae bacterium]|nr:hypothetical protein [Nitrospirota bacterium]
MPPVRRIGKNLVFKTATELIARVLSFAFYIVLARWLGEAAFGTFSLLYSVTAIVVFLGDPGLNILLIRQASRDSDFLENMAGAILALKALLCVAVIIVSSGYGYLAGYDLKMIGLFGLMGANMAAFSLADYAGAIFQSKEKMHIETVLMGAGKITVTGAAIMAMLLGSDIAITLIIMTVAQITATTAILTWTARYGVNIKPRWSARSWRNLLRQAWPLALILFFTIAFYRIDIALAPLLGVGLQQIGIYSAAIKLVDLSLVFPTLVMAAAFPTLSRMADEEYGQFKKWMNIIIASLGLIGLLIGGAIIPLSHNIIDLVFGPRFVSAGKPLVLLAMAMTFMFIRHAALNALIIVGASYNAVLLVAGALFVNISLNILLVPSAGITGAATAKLVTDIALTIGALLVWLRVSGKTGET